MEPPLVSPVTLTQSAIIAWRKERSVSQAKLGLMIGAPASMVAQYEAANRLYDIPRLVCLCGMGAITSAQLASVINDRLLGLFPAQSAAYAPIARKEAIAILKSALEAL